VLWVGAIALIVIAAGLIAVNLAKGKRRLAILGVFGGIGWIIGAIRLAKPNSFWARRWYGEEDKRRAWKRYPFTARRGTKDGRRKGRRVAAAAPRVFNFRPSDEDTIGLSTWWLLTNGSLWIHRRVESVTFVDDTTVRRQMSIDFTLPTQLGFLRPPSGSDAVFVPLALLKKRKLKNFDVWDEAGKKLPVLTTRENGEIAGCYLVAFATELAHLAGEGELPAHIKRDLYLIGGATGDVAARAFRRIAEGRGPDGALRQKLMENRVFFGQATELLKYFIVLVPITYPTRVAKQPAGEEQVNAAREEEPLPSRRRVFKFAYDETRRTQRPNWLQVRIWRRPVAYLLQSLERASLRAKHVLFDGLAVGDAQGFHLEVKAPEDLEVLFAGLWVDTGRSPPLMRDADGLCVQRAHLHVSSQARDARGTAVVRLRARRTGLVRAAALSAALTAILLHLGTARLPAIAGESLTPNSTTGAPIASAVSQRKRSLGPKAKMSSFSSSTGRPADRGTREAAAALLLLLPTILVAYLIRPGEHALATWLLLGVRAILLVVGLCSFLAAATLAADFGRDALHDRWVILSWIATGGAAVLALGLLLPVAGPRLRRAVR
jgi:hypothetical protein